MGQQHCCTSRESSSFPEGIGLAPRGAPKDSTASSSTTQTLESVSAWERQASKDENDIFDLTLKFISKVPLLQSIPLSDYPALARAFVLKDFDSGADVIRQGETGSEFFIVKKGKAKVLVDGQQVNFLSTGDFFGELALLHNTARNATITATDGSLQCLVISRENFNALELRKKLSFKRRKAMMMTEDAPEKSQDIPSKTSEDKVFIKEALQADAFLGPFLMGMTEQQLQNISNQAFLQQVPADTDIITQGDTKADLFYILQHGSATAYKDGLRVASYTEKGSFGGLALLYQAPRAATVRITSSSRVWCIPRSAMRAVLQQEVKDKVAGYAKLLGKVKIFDALSAEDKSILADALLETTYNKGQLVTEQGQDSKAFFVLECGEVAEIENGEQVSTINTECCEDCPFFGEHALIEEPYGRTVQVTSDKAAFLLLDRATFQRLSKPSDDDVRPKDYIEYKLAELSMIGLLGCGFFGKVTLEKYSKTGQQFAVKKLSKGFVVENRQQKSVMNEARILRMTDSPFLIKVAATFNRGQHLYFLLEPALGGELFTVYSVHNLHGNERLARFYSACVAKGLAHLHERCIVYRDMKPENLLLDEKGYLKITDFGLAKFCIGKTFTTCGTPEFFAPEMVKGVGHTTALDWWTLGILIFEFMRGFTPFAAEEPPQIFAKLVKGIDTVRFPATRSKWPDLVKSLCRMQPGERLPVRPGGLKNLEEHEWYKSNRFDWDLLVTRKMKAPFLPEVVGDASNFIADAQEGPPEKLYIDPMDGWDADFEDAWGPKSFEIL